MRLSLKMKILCGFLFVLIISISLIYFFVNDMLYENMKNTIDKDVENLQRYSRNDIKQISILNQYSNDDLEKKQKYILQELVKKLECNIAVYNNESLVYNGILEQGSIPVVIEQETKVLKECNSIDLDLARNNQAGYKINKIEEQYILSFSYPVYINNKFFGILRFTKDYTNLFTINDKNIKKLFAFSFGILILVCIISIILSQCITKPISKLINAVKEVQEGKYNNEITINTKDEIQDLAVDFNLMNKQIQNQIVRIEEEKNNVIQLEKARREFFNNVTHDLKTPLTIISGYAQIIGEKGFEDIEFLERAALQIKNESDRLHNMVVEIIEISKKNSSIKEKPFEKIEIKNLLESICEDMNLKASKYNMKIKYKLEPMFIRGRSTELTEVFINILDNAIKYGYNNSEIIVRNSIINDEISEIEVINQSNEIEDNNIHRIFDKDFQIDKRNQNEKGSRGLGLYICKQIIESHGGTIEMTHKNGITKIIIKISIWQ